MRLSRQSTVLGIVALAAVASVAVGVFALRSPGARKERYWHQAEAYLKAGKNAEAVIALENFVQLDPRSSQGFLKLGGAYLSLQNPRKALSAFSRAAELAPNLVEAQFHAAELLLLNGKMNEARAKAQLVVEKDPANHRAWLVLAQSYAGERQWDEADDFFRQYRERIDTAINARVGMDPQVARI